MDQNIIGLVLKTGGHPEPVTVSGCHGNQVKFKISISKKFLISPPSKKRSTDKIFTPTIVKKTKKIVMGIFMRITVTSSHRNHLFLTIPHFAPYPKQALTSPLAEINSFLISPLIIIVPKFSILLFA